MVWQSEEKHIQSNYNTATFGITCSELIVVTNDKNRDIQYYQIHIILDIFNQQVT